MLTDGWMAVPVVAVTAYAAPVMGREHERHEGHERFDGLALDHVLGGLSGRRATDFRTHLATCTDCRSRVAELRGIAAELGEIERDERSRARLRTEVARREEPDPAEVTPTHRLTIGHVTAVAVAVLLVAVGVAFWNLHLRTQVDAYASVVSSQSDALRDLATGIEVQAQFREGVSGRFVATDQRVAFALSGLELRPREIAAVWTTDDDGEVELAEAVPDGLLLQGTYAGVVERGGVTAIIITREDGRPVASPSGRELARTDLRALVD